MRILLIGPTAVGKTELSINLAKSTNAEIISADSRQCYKYLDIGTAKPTERELHEVRHYNISILEPDEEDSAVDFYERTQQWEQEIEQKGKNVLFVGGSTLHVQSLIKPFDDVPEADEENIEHLEQRLADEGVESLYAQLEDVDPHYAEKMDGMNTQRILRALDVWMQTGKAFSSYHSDDDEIEIPGDTYVFGLKRERQKLYDRINQRVDQMFELGFLDEVQKLLNMGYTRETRALNSVGYRDAIDYLESDKSREKMIKDMKTQTRRYAKRQITWFKRWDFVEWIDMDEHTNKEALGIIMEKLPS
ncbi:tRNA (adenosine(37)-N6)-dimethylallyltransferase MiaA [Aliifodinibius sp. S!AR15-10]|uniref:tRNA (adenosine(37)-N6)-dimethylallyltransferase MiaA n=1 Tax=Aliifodinibius sp. S!AR15-10 TaxID=2950437 RepID=UPI0028677327|nr:tRNA (adenosine(37)-N6)-dimethylallyltransferase MiaA [Aliifodinibius sp. S!AR15-10]MDR8392988.1 tRNA (adenosine(37)-N6)-dimethylallyltransferase MiaA [Aliifodinibius sp. S!AR15-10]